MENFIRKKPNKPSFSQKGLKGYIFPLESKKIEIDFVDVKKGHDNFFISRKITHIYYILEGKGNFIIASKKYNVSKGMVIEVPKGIEYTYSGKMKTILILDHLWFDGNEKITRVNPSVK